jgi:hypothetical protein
MQVCGREFGPQLLQRIQQTVDQEPDLSRRALSRLVCEWLNWRTALQELQEVSCRVALLKLHRRGALDLPAVAPAVVSPPRPLAARRAPQPIVVTEASLEALQPLSLRRIEQADCAASRLWNQMMERYHYLGAGPLCGAQMRYAVHSRQGEWLGGLAFSGAAWQLAARDEWIGWSDQARRQHLQQVIANSRFLILPHWRVPNLASHVLSLALQQVADDWQERYGYRPLLVETFVDAERFTGACYRAANWLEVGQTTGRGRQDREHAGGQAVKRVFLYALHAQARERLGGQAPTSPPAPAGWPEEEFGGARLGDARLRERLLILARDFYARPQANLPQACQTRARTKAAYYFLEHPETSMDALLEPHYEATRQRVAAERLVFAVQDTTFLNYSTHPETDDLGPIGSDKSTIGLVLHSTLAFNAAGTPLGFLDVQCWARDGAQFGKRHRRKDLPIEEKESMKWLKSFQQVAEVQRRTPCTRLVSVGDREADIYELFQLARAEENAPWLLVRADRDRLREDGQEHLWPWLAQQAVAGIQEVQVPRRGKQPARVARLEVRFAQVTLRPPHGKEALGELTLWAVLAQEVEAPQGVKEPLLWMLLTTCPVESFAGACQKVSWYTLRWGIEVYHRTLKSGCRIEQRQLGKAERIEACLAIDLVVAWRIFHLTKLGREVPDVPCSVYFEEAEWKALVAYTTHNPTPPQQPPSLREAVRRVATLGGFLGRKSDGEPGTQTLWLGLQRLDDLTAMWKLLTHTAHSPPVSSRRYG